MMSFIRDFIDCNKRAYTKIATIFPNNNFSIYGAYLQKITEKLPQQKIIVDIGSGKRCLFSEAINECEKTRLYCKKDSYHARLLLKILLRRLYIQLSQQKTSHKLLLLADYS